MTFDLLGVLRMPIAPIDVHCASLYVKMGNLTQSRLIRHPSKGLIRLKSPPADAQRPAKQPTGGAARPLIKVLFLSVSIKDFFFFIIEGKLRGH